MDERLSMITGLLDPHKLAKTGHERRTEAYLISHELMILRACKEPKLLRTLRMKMKSKQALTTYVLQRLERKREVKISTNSQGPLVTTTELGSRRVEHTFGGWKEMRRAFGISVPTAPFYYPSVFRLAV